MLSRLIKYNLPSLPEPSSRCGVAALPTASGKIVGPPEPRSRSAESSGCSLKGVK